MGTGVSGSKSKTRVMAAERTKGKVKENWEVTSLGPAAMGGNGGRRETGQ